MKKAETEADQFYEKCCKEEAKVSDLQNDIEQKIKEIHQLKQELENMESTGHSMKENGEPSALKKKFTQIYSKYHVQSRQDGLCHFRASIMDTDCNSRKVPMDTKV
jgi:uncharacterized coiled-coil DUF342 family protein